MRYFNLLIFVCFTSFLVGCGSSVPVIKPFKMDIQQGNVVTSKMLLQLRPGMTKSQVRFIMGTPLVVDSFHTNRWDYFYQMRQAGKVVDKRRVILDFDKDLLVKVRGDVVPEGTAGADAGLISNDGVTAPKSIETPPKKEEGGLLDKLMFWKSDSKASATSTKPAAPVASTPVVTTPIELPSIETSAPTAQAVPIALPDEPAVEMPKVDSSKLAAEKAEAAKLEAAKAEAVRLEAAKVEAARIDTAKQAAAKAEAAKLEAAKVEAAKIEAAKAEAAKVEAAKVEAAKAEAARMEVAKLEAAKAAAAQQEAKTQAVKAAQAAADEAAAAATANPPVVAVAPVVELPAAAPAKPVAAKPCYRAQCADYKGKVSVSPAVTAKP